MTRTGRRHAPAIAFLGLLLAAVVPAGAASAQAAAADLAGRFKRICGTTTESGPALAGADVKPADAPQIFASDLQRAVNSRVVETDDGYAMRALVPSEADPLHAMYLKCAVASRSASFARQVEQLSTMLSAKARVSKGDYGIDYARFPAGMTSFLVFGDPGGWVSIFKLDLIMRNIDPKYLKKGGKPAPPPPVR